ncbi:hypothetical protein ZTR_10554 [Talaromyces verruculosus]|nr:hypothetical protein ZTR_10554 [Talaromyces verruculosus]
MSIPTKTTVLVVGGGPGGSYTAAALAREGIDTVLLEADIFPRYHVGESMVASIRHFLRFIDLDTTFNNHGFIKKTGAAFKLNNQKTAYTDFIVAAGPDSYAWNVIRSEADDLIFRHAGKSGAKIFDGVKVTSLEFVPNEGANLPTDGTADPGRPVSATWTAKDGRTGSISFDYLVDASGRVGIVTTKYLKTRSYNQDLKNVASWGYWRGAISYGVGTPKEGQPFFEALQDGSGWVWFIPLHDGTVSVGVVMNQEMSTQKKKESTTDNGRDFYIESIKDAHGVTHLLQNAELDTEVKHASDWSYSASEYASPYVRVVGDAGCFIDPYFSSGVHLAFSGALSAAVSISASIRGHCNETQAWKWHSTGVRDRFTRFLLVVMSATKQIRARDAPILNNQGEDGFDDAFTIIRPVIQGISDVTGKTTHDEVSRAVDFTTEAVGKTKPDDSANSSSQAGPQFTDTIQQGSLTKDEAKVLHMVKNVFKDFFVADVYNGYRAKLERGSLGLEKVNTEALLMGEKLSGIRTEVKEVEV